MKPPKYFYFRVKADIDGITLEDASDADVVEVVRCKDCIYWQRPQVKLKDGTYRDYEPGEYENGSIFGGVELSVGINVGAFCAKYDKWHTNAIHQFMSENDFCSKGEKRAECTK